VLRNIVSFALVTVLLLVAAGGACMACSNQLAAKPSPGCCDKTCPRPQKSQQPEHAGCAAAAVSDVAIEASLKFLSTDFIGISAAIELPLVADAVAPYRAEPIPPVFSPPDRCLLNCVILV